jgi:hypothetical protein
MNSVTMISVYSAVAFFVGVGHPMVARLSSAGAGRVAARRGKARGARSSPQSYSTVQETAASVAPVQRRPGDLAKEIRVTVAASELPVPWKGGEGLLPGRTRTGEICVTIRGARERSARSVRDRSA